MGVSIGTWRRAAAAVCDKKGVTMVMAVEMMEMTLKKTIVDAQAVL